MSGWRDYIEVDGEEREIDTRESPENESDNHFYKKIILADTLEEMGFEEVHTEVDHHFKDIRYDVYGISDTGMVQVGEIGELNCSYSNFKERMKDYYNDLPQVEVVIWWLKDYRGPVIPDPLIDELLAEGNQCPICRQKWKEGEISEYKATWIVPFANQFEGTGKIYVIQLKHLFEPEKFHQELEEFQEKDS